MDNLLLKKDLIKVQEGNDEILLTVINNFNPLISKCAYLLNYEDSKSDLCVFFIELIQNLKLNKFQNDSQIVSYIAKSMKHEYIRLSKIKVRHAENEILIGHELENEISYDPIIEEDNLIYIKQILNDYLTQKEKTVLYAIYFMDYSVSEIANLYHISRQAVNKTKNKAKLKIQKNLESFSLQ